MNPKSMYLRFHNLYLIYRIIKLHSSIHLYTLKITYQLKWKRNF